MEYGRRVLWLLSCTVEVLVVARYAQWSFLQGIEVRKGNSWKYEIGISLPMSWKLVKNNLLVSRI